MLSGVLSGVRVVVLALLFTFDGGLDLPSRPLKSRLLRLLHLLHHHYSLSSCHRLSSALVKLHFLPPQRSIYATTATATCAAATPPLVLLLFPFSSPSSVNHFLPISITNSSIPDSIPITISALPAPSGWIAFYLLENPSLATLIFPPLQRFFVSRDDLSASLRSLGPEARQRGTSMLATCEVGGCLTPDLCLRADFDLCCSPFPWSASNKPEFNSSPRPRHSQCRSSSSSSSSSSPICLH